MLSCICFSLQCPLEIINLYTSHVVVGQGDERLCAPGFPSRSTLANSPSSQVQNDRQYIFPDIRFSPGCSGRITEWKFVATAWDLAELSNPELQIWRLSTGMDYTKVNSTTIRLQQSTADTQIYTYDVDPPLTFLPGDVLGVYTPRAKDSHLQLLFQQRDNVVSYYSDRPSMPFNSISVSTLTSDSIIPLVNVEVLAGKLVSIWYVELCFK